MGDTNGLDASLRGLSLEASASAVTQDEASKAPVDTQSPAPAPPVTPAKKKRGKKAAASDSVSPSNAIIRRIGTRDSSPKNADDPYQARRHPSYLSLDVAPYAARVSPSKTPGAETSAAFLAAHPPYFARHLKSEEAAVARAAGLLLLRQSEGDSWSALMVREARTNKRTNLAELSVPGGKVDAADAHDPLRTALREFDEETCSTVTADELSFVEKTIRGDGAVNEPAPDSDASPASSLPESQCGVLWWAGGKYALYVYTMDDTSSLKDLALRRAQQRAAAGVTTDVNQKGDEFASLHWVPLTSLSPPFGNPVQVHDDQSNESITVPLSTVARGVFGDMRFQSFLEKFKPAPSEAATTTNTDTASADAVPAQA